MRSARAGHERSESTSDDSSYGCAAAPPVMRNLGEARTEIVQRVAEGDHRYGERNEGEAVQCACHKSPNVVWRARHLDQGPTPPMPWGVMRST